MQSYTRGSGCCGVGPSQSTNLTLVERNQGRNAARTTAHGKRQFSTRTNSTLNHAQQRGFGCPAASFAR
eukprot:567260-Rhodomonas_salina.2